MDRDIDEMRTGEGFGRDAIACALIVAANALYFDGRMFALKRLIQSLPALRLPRDVGHYLGFFFRGVDAERDANQQCEREDIRGLPHK